MPRDLSPKERSTEVLQLTVREFSKAEFIVFARCVIKDALERDIGGVFGRQSSDLGSMITGGVAPTMDPEILARIVKQFGSKGVQPMSEAESVQYPHLPITIGNRFYEFLCQEYPEDIIGSDPHDGITEPEKRQQKQDSYRAQCGKNTPTPDAELQYYDEVARFYTDQMQELTTVSQQLIEYAFNGSPAKNCCRVVIHGQKYTLPYYHPKALSVSDEQRSGCCDFWRRRHPPEDTDTSPLLPQASSNKFCPFSCTLL